MARGFSGKYASCAVNPSCTMEGRYPLEPVGEPTRLLVIGGGPGGMTAAIAGARRGMDVSLWESADRLGGCLLAASAPDFKRDVRRLLDHLLGQVEKLGIEVRLGARALPANIAAEKPDAVIVATGASPGAVAPGLVGATPALDVLTGSPALSGRVVVAGAGVVGCETALFLAGQGCDVTVVDPAGMLVSEPVFTLNRASLLEKMEAGGVKTMPGVELVEVVEGGARVSSEGSESLIECDSVVLAMGSVPGEPVAEGLTGDGMQVRVIGDAVKPRKVLDAVWEGFHAARLL